MILRGLSASIKAHGLRFPLTIVFVAAVSTLIFFILGIYPVRADPIPAGAFFKTGSYTGTQAARSITVGFLPDVVIIKGDTNSIAQIKTSAMPATTSKSLGSASNPVTNAMTAFSSTGFGLTNNAALNGNGIVYHWVAFTAYAGEVNVGTYTGSAAADNRSISGVGFQPDLVFVMPANNVAPVIHPSTLAGDNSFNLLNGAATADYIQSLAIPAVDGFQVGTLLNANNVIYYFVALKNISGRIVSGSYTGNGTAGTDITIPGTSFQPAWVLVKTSGQLARHRPDTMGVIDDSLGFTNVASNTNWIQLLNVDGFKVGSDASVNTNPNVYHWTAFKYFLAYTAPDSASITDSIVKAVSFTRMDSPSIVDTVQQAVTKTFSDAITVTESMLSLKGRNLSDAVTSTDSLVKSLSLQRSDSTAVTDSIQKAFARGVDDSVAIAEAILSVRLKELSDTQTTTDSIVNALSFTRSESANLVDSLQQALTSAKDDLLAVTDLASVLFPRGVQDSQSITDSIAKAVSFSRADTNSLGESIQQAFTSAKDDLLAVTDLASFLYPKNFQDTQSITDSIAKALTFSRADTNSLGESIQQVFTSAKDDLLAVTDLASILYPKNVQDAQSITDSLSKVFNLSRSESGNVGESIQSALASAKNDVLAVTDFMSRSNTRGFNDVGSVSESVLRAISITRLESIELTEIMRNASSKAKSDLLTFVDSVFTSRFRGIGDSSGIVDGVAKALTYRRPDTATIIGTVTADASKTTADTATISDSIGSLRGLPKGDSASIVDSLLLSGASSRGDSSQVSDGFSLQLTQAIPTSPVISAASVTMNTVGVTTVSTPNNSIIAVLPTGARPPANANDVIEIVLANRSLPSVPFPPSTYENAVAFNITVLVNSTPTDLTFAVPIDLYFPVTLQLLNRVSSDTSRLLIRKFNIGTNTWITIPSVYQGGSPPAPAGFAGRLKVSTTSLSFWALQIAPEGIVDLPDFSTPTPVPTLAPTAVATAAPTPAGPTPTPVPGATATPAGPTPTPSLVTPTPSLVTPTPTVAAPTPTPTQIVVGPTPSPAPTVIATGTPVPGSFVESTVLASGGVVSLPNGEVVLLVPEGFSDSQVAFRVALISPDSEAVRNSTLPDNTVIGSTLALVSPRRASDGASSFDVARPMTITIKYTQSDLDIAGGDSTRLAIARQTPERNWSLLQTTVNPADRTLSALLTSACDCIYAVAALTQPGQPTPVPTSTPVAPTPTPAPAAPEISVRNIVITGLTLISLAIVLGASIYLVIRLVRRRRE